MATALSLAKRHPDRVPVIVNPGNMKLLVPRDMTVAQFAHILRGHVDVTAEAAMFLFTGDDSTMPPSGRTMSELPFDDDGFRRVTWKIENTFGSS